MSLHINRFIDKIRSAESRSQRDIILSVAEARDLHADITKLLLALQESHERKSAPAPSDPANLEIDGGSF
jgi:hypothetical protein